MKFYNKIIGYCTSALLLASLFGCAKEAELVKPSALMAESSVTIAAKGGEAVAFTVYSDEDWFVDAEEDWLYVTPTSGTGTMDIEISADDNVIDGVMQKPRQGTVTIANRRGYSIKSVVYQKGDTYFGDPDYTVTQALAMENEATAKIKGAQVMALTLSGMVISDGTSNLMVDGVGKDVKIGDKIDINGKAKVEEGTYMHFVLDECEIVSEGEPAYPAAKDITAEIATASPEALEYVTVKGSIVGLSNEGVLAGAAIRVAGATVRMMVAEVPASLGLAEVNYHKVEVSGYYTGKSGSNLRFIPAVFKDNGLDESVVPVPSEPGTVLFEDNFDWMEPYVDAAIKAGTAIASSVEENNAGGSAPNLYTTASLADLRAALISRGYKNANYSITDGIYAQKCYWKFGKTGVHAGLELPAVDYYGELQLCFDWSPHMTGSGNIDKLTLVVAVTTGESTVIAGEYSYKDWTKGQLAWHGVKTTINITPESIIQIRPSHLENHDGIDQQRFYVDNIVVRVPAPDQPPVYANIVVDPDEALTFEGDGSDRKITVTSDVNFTIAASEKWITLSEYEGKKNDPTEITVTCAASDLSVIREGKLTITSGDSSKEIRIIQSAAGQTLEPFISIVGGNSTTVAAAAGTYPIKIQANVPFEFSTDVNWISPAPQTKALVTVTDAAFVVAANNTSDDRVAHIKFFNKDNNIETVYTVTQLSDHAKLPVKWTLRSSCNFNSTWTYPNTPNTPTVEDKTGYMNATTGLGTIWFSNSNGVAADTGKKCSLDVSDNSPRVMGVWIGDFCQFKVPGKVDAGKKVRISFETRVSKTHPKYWRLQYLDGSDWKDACATKTAQVEGEGDVVYTHQMANDGATNIQVDATVTYGADTDNIVFRFICQTAMQASGAGCLAAPNGGSWRLSITNKADNDQWQPTIQYVD